MAPLPYCDSVSASGVPMPPSTSMKTPIRVPPVRRIFRRPALSTMRTAIPTPTMATIFWTMLKRKLWLA